MNSLIRFLDRNTEKRKKIKKRIDSELNLSAEHDEGDMKLSVAAFGSERNRLLDEGAIIEGDGSVFAYIKKGTIEKFMTRSNVYLDNLPEDFVGSINIGHLDYVEFPFPLGEWTMDNMTMVDIGEGRKGIDMDATLDDDSMFVQELRRIGYEVSMSVEMQTHTDWEATEDLGMWVIDEILIYAYAVVGDGKNVTSNGWKLKGELDMKKEQLEELKAKLSDSEDTELSVETEEETETAEDTANTDEASETELSAEEETEEEGAEEVDLSAGEEIDGEESEDAEEAEDEEATYEDIEAYVESLNDAVTQLKAEVAELKKTNKRLNKKLKAELGKKSEFVSKFRTLAENTGVDEADAPVNEKVTDYIYGDGIGE